VRTTTTKRSERERRKEGRKQANSRNETSPLEHILDAAESRSVMHDEDMGASIAQLLEDGRGCFSHGLAVSGALEILLNGQRS